MFPWQCAYSTFWSFENQSVGRSLLGWFELAPSKYSSPSIFFYPFLLSCFFPSFLSVRAFPFYLSSAFALNLFSKLQFIYGHITPNLNILTFYISFFHIIFVYLFLSISGTFYLYCISLHHSCCCWFEPCGHHRCYSAFTSFPCLVTWYWILTMRCHSPSGSGLHTESSNLLKISLLTYLRVCLLGDYKDRLAKSHLKHKDWYSKQMESESSKSRCTHICQSRLQVKNGQKRQKISIHASM